MKNLKFLIRIPWLALIVAILIGIFRPFDYSGSAVISRGYTFATNEQVTAAKLHALVDNATISGISSADLTNGVINNAALAANSVTTDKILDGTIQGSDISNNTITASNISSNSIAGYNLQSNFVFSAGTLNMTNTILQLDTNNAVSSSVGVADAGKLIKLDSSGRLPLSTVTNIPIHVIIVQDQESQNVAGGTFTSGAWQTRVINTKIADTGSNLVALAANQLTFSNGTYRCMVTAPAYAVDLHQLRLADTAGTVLAIGQASESGAAGNRQTVSIVMGRFTFTTNSTFTIQHRCTTTKSGDGFGQAANFGTEVYTQATFWKE